MIMMEKEIIVSFRWMDREVQKRGIHFIPFLRE